jgi:hypothetical protein
MAPRLAVVVSQAPMRDARVADIEESIVAELIMVGGLDATLVGPLERILRDSTDLLCLSGFTQDLALLSWMPTDDAARLWAGLQLTGTVVPMSLDGSAAAPSSQIAGRRVFYIQLTAQSVPTQVCLQLKARLELLRVQPVSLQLNMKSPMKNLPVAKPKPVADPHMQPLGQPLGQPLVQPLVQPAPLATPTGPSSDSQWKNLDQLVDELDLLDL